MTSLTNLSEPERVSVAKVGRKVRQLELNARADRAWAEKQAAAGRMIEADMALTIAAHAEKAAEALKARWGGCEGFNAGYTT